MKLNILFLDYLFGSIFNDNTFYWTVFINIEHSDSNTEHC